MHGCAPKGHNPETARHVDLEPGNQQAQDQIQWKALYTMEGLNFQWKALISFEPMEDGLGFPGMEWVLSREWKKNNFFCCVRSTASIQLIVCAAGKWWTKNYSEKDLANSVFNF